MTILHKYLKGWNDEALTFWTDMDVTDWLVERYRPFINMRSCLYGVLVDSMYMYLYSIYLYISIYTHTFENIIIIF